MASLIGRTCACGIACICVHVSHFCVHALRMSDAHYFFRAHTCTDGLLMRKASGAFACSCQALSPTTRVAVCKVSAHTLCSTKHAEALP
jgi:hypothetical protein